MSIVPAVQRGPGLQAGDTWHNDHGRRSPRVHSLYIQPVILRHLARLRHRGISNLLILLEWQRYPELRVEIQKSLTNRWGFFHFCSK